MEVAIELEAADVEVMADDVALFDVAALLDAAWLEEACELELATPVVVVVLLPPLETTK